MWYILLEISDMYRDNGMTILMRESIKLLIIVLDNYDYASIPSKSLNGWLELLQSMENF